MNGSYDARCGLFIRGRLRRWVFSHPGRRLALVCEVCGTDLIGGRDDVQVLEHMQAIAGRHYEREHADRRLGSGRMSG